MFAGAALKVCILAAIILAGSRLGDAIAFDFSPQLTPSTEPVVHRTIVISAAIYVILMMTPFVPGVEIGLALMVGFGAPIVPLVWGATVLALSLTFLLGGGLPEERVLQLLRCLGFRKLVATLEGVQNKPRHERLQLMVSGASQRWVSFLIRHRLLLLIVAFNVPGNAVVGGGGGIALMAGFSRLFSFPGFLLAMTLATSPIPVAFLLYG